MFAPIAEDVLSVRDGRLYIEERDVAGLAEEFGSPLFVVSERKLRDNVQRFQQSFSAAWPYGEARVLASFKASQALAVRRVLTVAGAGCDCFGVAEIHGAVTADTPPGLVSVNGSFKDLATVRAGVEHGARITLDAPYELDLVEAVARELGVVARVAIRLRPWLGEIATPSDLRDEFPLGMALHVGKYGVPAEEVDSLAARAQASPNADLEGFHFHGGRHSLDPGVWREIGRGVGAEVARRSAALDGWSPRVIDCGGGFPSPRDAVRRARPEERHRPAPPVVEVYADALAGGLAEGLRHGGLDPEGIALEVEPGRGLYADTAIHLARVRAVKETATPVPHRWVGVDTTVMNLHDVAFLQARFDHVVANRADCPDTWRADIVGLTCTVDRITPDAALPVVGPGDVIAFLGTGAYQEAGAPNFNGLPRAGSVLVAGEDAEVIRRPETVADVFGRDVVPERLRVAGTAVLR